MMKVSLATNRSLMATLRKLIADQSGQGLIEYAMVATLVSIAAVALCIGIGTYLPHLFDVPLNAL